MEVRLDNQGRSLGEYWISRPLDPKDTDSVKSAVGVLETLKMYPNDPDAVDLSRKLENKLKGLGVDTVTSRYTDRERAADKGTDFTGNAETGTVGTVPKRSLGVSSKIPEKEPSSNLDLMPPAEPTAAPTRKPIPQAPYEPEGFRIPATEYTGSANAFEDYIRETEGGLPTETPKPDAKEALKKRYFNTETEKKEAPAPEYAEIHPTQSTSKYFPFGERKFGLDMAPSTEETANPAQEPWLRQWTEDDKTAPMRHSPSIKGSAVPTNEPWLKQWVSEDKSVPMRHSPDLKARYDQEIPMIKPGEFYRGGIQERDLGSESLKSKYGIPTSPSAENIPTEEATQPESSDGREYKDWIPAGKNAQMSKTLSRPGISAKDEAAIRSAASGVEDEAQKRREEASASYADYQKNRKNLIGEYQQATGTNLENYMKGMDRIQRRVFIDTIVRSIGKIFAGVQGQMAGTPTAQYFKPEAYSPETDTAQNREAFAARQAQAKEGYQQRIEGAQMDWEQRAKLAEQELADMKAKYGMASEVGKTFATPEQVSAGDTTQYMSKAKVDIAAQQQEEKAKSAAELAKIRAESQKAAAALRPANVGTTVQIGGTESKGTTTQRNKELFDNARKAEYHMSRAYSVEGVKSAIDDGTGKSLVRDPQSLSLFLRNRVIQSIAQLPENSEDRKNVVGVTNTYVREILKNLRDFPYNGTPSQQAATIDRAYSSASKSLTDINNPEYDLVTRSETSETSKSEKSRGTEQPSSIPAPVPAPTPETKPTAQAAPTPGAKPSPTPGAKPAPTPGAKPSPTAQAKAPPFRVEKDKAGGYWAIMPDGRRKPMIKNPTTGKWRIAE